MENALRACCKGIKIGKILIHREGKSGRQVSQTNSSFIAFSLSPVLVMLKISRTRENSPVKKLICKKNSADMIRGQTIQPKSDCIMQMLHQISEHSPRATRKVV